MNNQAYRINHTSEKLPPDGPGWDDYYWVERVSDGECICTDLAEPEDKILVRHFKSLVDELNRVAKLLEDEIGV